MPLSACCSSKEKAMSGTSSETGRMVTVDKLEAGLPASHLLFGVWRARLWAAQHKRAFLIDTLRASKRRACCSLNQHKLWMYTWKEIGVQLPPRGPLTCCMFPRIFCPSRWISRVTTWGYLLLIEFRAPLGSLASSESRTAWTVVARFMWVSASTWSITEPDRNYVILMLCCNEDEHITKL